MTRVTFSLKVKWAAWLWPLISSAYRITALPSIQSQLGRVHFK